MVTVEELERQFFKQFGPGSVERRLATEAADAVDMEVAHEAELENVYAAQAGMRSKLEALRKDIDDFIQSDDAPEWDTLTDWAETLDEVIGEL